MSKYEDTLKRVLKMSFRSTRAEMGITQAQMAELLHISTRAYAELEYGRSLCSTSVFVACKNWKDKKAHMLVMSGQDSIALSKAKRKRQEVKGNV